MRVVIGKYTLESLTSGMYTTPMVIYREYIQNAVDSIDDAIEDSLITIEDARVNIIVDDTNNKIVIEDNGMGISSTQAIRTLINIGDSNKSLKKQRGFRGIGRLSGLAYCNKVIFRTKYKGELFGTELSFDGAKLAEILVSGRYENFDLKRTLTEVVESSVFDEDEGIHYFKVTLEGVKDIGGILDVDKVQDFICQVAPLPYNTTSFSGGRDINQALELAGCTLRSYNVFLSQPNGIPQQLYKLFTDQFIVGMSKHQVDKLKGIKIKNVYSPNGKILAIMWYGESGLYGTIVDERIKGFRFRKGNMLVGDKSSANGLFKEDRFNGWFQGEIFVLAEDIIPNARRDDFERNDTYLNLATSLNYIGAKLSKTIRNVSSQRVKELDPFEKISILTNSKHPASVTKYPEINLCNHLSINEKKLLGKVFEIIDNGYPTDISSNIKSQIKVDLL